MSTGKYPVCNQSKRLFDEELPALKAELKRQVDLGRMARRLEQPTRCEPPDTYQMNDLFITRRSPEEIAKMEIDARERQLVKASDAYHNTTAHREPLMSDAVYDALRTSHKAAYAKYPHLFPEDTILKRVGAAVAPDTGFARQSHKTPMLSLDNVFEGADGNLDELNTWLAGIENSFGKEVRIVIEPKIDGLSLRLNFLANLLKVAATRGDGAVGDDVTVNVKTAAIVTQSLRTMPTPPPEKGKELADGVIYTHGDLEINGEVFMDFAAFERLNERCRERKEPEYANPRNAASGSLRLHDPQECARRGLRFLAHGVHGGPYTSYLEARGDLMNRGIEFPAVLIAAASHRWQSVEELKSALQRDIDYPIDGLVFKVDSYGVREALGETSDAPRWAVALKFQQPVAHTRLDGITIQVGRSGVMTPVAELEPVLIDGSTVSRATLHNEDRVRLLGLQIGDTVAIRKAGAIIPEIVESITHSTRQAELYEFFRDKHTDYTPEELTAHVRLAIADERPPFNLLMFIDGKCPSCGGTDIQKISSADQLSGAPDGKKSTAAWRCMNSLKCPAQLAGRIRHFVSRGALDITGIGEECAQAIADSKLLRNGPIDLFDWTINDLAEMVWVTDNGTMRFGSTRATTAVNAMISARKLPLNRWLAALGIPSIGENTSKEISRLCRNATEIMELAAPRCIQTPAVQAISWIAYGSGKVKDETLTPFQISGHLGPVSCRALQDFAKSPEGNYAFNRMAEFGITSGNYNPVPVASDDKPLFGKNFAITGTLSVSRDEMKALIEGAGGKVSGSVSAKTHYLVVGEGGGGKAAKAQAAGVGTLTEAELRAML